MAKWLLKFEVPLYLSGLGNLNFEENVSTGISSDKGEASPNSKSSFYSF